METLSRNVWVLEKTFSSLLDQKTIRKLFVNLQQSKVFCIFGCEFWWRYMYLWMDQVDSEAHYWWPIHFHNASLVSGLLYGYLLLGFAIFWQHETYIKITSVNDPGTIDCSVVLGTALCEEHWFYPVLNWWIFKRAGPRSKPILLLLGSASIFSRPKSLDPLKLWVLESKENFQVPSDRYTREVNAETGHLLWAKNCAHPLKDNSISASP